MNAPLNADKRQIIAGARHYFAVFLTLVFNELHQGDAPLEIAWYLKAICHALIDACSRPGARLVIAVPPRHLKSIAASVALPAFLLGLDPTRRIMVATYSQELARLHAVHTRRIMQSVWYRLLFPGTRLAGDGTRIFELKTTAGGGRKAVSVGGTVTGFGADVIIVDDCLKAEDARSQAMRDEVKNWFDGTLQTRQNQAGRGVIIAIAQRLHEDDLPAHLIDKHYDLLCLPAIAEKEERIAIGKNVWHDRRVGDVLDRPGQTRELLDALRRDLGPQVFSAQYQQTPVAPEGNLIRLEWFGTYDGVPERENFYRIAQSWDTGMTDSPTSDFSVCTTWGWRDHHWWLVDVLRERLAFPDLKRAVERLRRQWKADAVVIEQAGTGHALFQEFRADRVWRPVMWSVDGGKEERLIGVSGQLESGLCLLPADAPWLDAFRSELRAFPHGRHDDQVDSLSQFVEYHLLRGKSLLAERDEFGRRLYIDRPSLARSGRY
jgi:predicted phage terminase large subunit-like protein